jgi:hypothetical protein
MSSLDKQHCPQQRSERSREACRFVLQNEGAEHRCLQHMAIDQQPDHCRSPATPAAAGRRLSGRAAGVVPYRHEGGADRRGCAKDHPRANHLVRTACRGVAAQVFPRPLANPRAGPDVFRSALGHSRPGRADSRSGDVGYPLIATDFSGAAKFRHVPLSDLALSQYDFAETVGKGEGLCALREC